MDKIKKAGKIFLDVLMYIFLAVCICAVVLTVISKRDSDGAAEIFGYQLRLVTSSSMAACEHTDVSEFEIKDIPLRSMVFVEVMPEDPEKADAWYRSLRVGDVLTFRYVYTKQVTITHRITSITEKETGGFVIELAGDNKDSDKSTLYQTIDTSVPNNMNYVIGKVTGQSYLLGVVMSILMQPIAIVLIIIVPCVIIIILEVLKIVRVFTDEKKEKERIAAKEKDDELEELRRRLAELEMSQKPSENGEDKEEM